MKKRKKKEEKKKATKKYEGSPSLRQNYCVYTSERGIYI